MAFFSATLATSQPLNLATGFELFPPNTTLVNPQDPTMIGFDGSEPEFGEPILNLNIPIFLFRLQTQVSARFIAAAFAGYNLQYSAFGNISNNGGSLFVGSDRSAGGIGFGLGWDLDVAFNIQRSNITFNWRSGFRTTWQDVFNFKTLISVDLIQLTVDLLMKAGFNLSPLAQIRDVAPGKGTIWGLYDSTSGQIASKGYIELKPKVALHGDLVETAGKLSSKVGAFLKGLKAIGGKVKAGPVLNFYFPVKIQIVRLTTQFGNYDVTTVSTGQGNSAGFSLAKRDGGPVVGDVRNFSVTHTHSIDFKIGLAIKFKFKLWSVFIHEVSIPIDLTDNLPALKGSTFGLPPLFGPYFGRLANPPVASTAAMELPEVIWG